MGVIAEGILRGCQGLFTPVSLGYPLSVFNKNSSLKDSFRDCAEQSWPKVAQAERNRFDSKDNP